MGVDPWRMKLYHQKAEPLQFTSDKDVDNQVRGRFGGMSPVNSGFGGVKSSILPNIFIILKGC